MKRIVAVLAATLLSASPFALQAQGTYPVKPVRIIVPCPAGGTADVLPRIVGERLNARWGQPGLVENRVGAGANIGA